MTDTNHPTTDTNSDETPSGESRAPINRRLALTLAGAGIAGAAVVATGNRASAADGQNVIIGTDNVGTTVTSLANDTVAAPIAGPANAFKGMIASATNGSHTILGTTAGDGHAIAGVNSKLDNTRAATWGRHLGAGPGAEGENAADNVPLAGTGNGVLGLITKPTNGSHAVKGVTAGAGHSIAGDTPANAQDGAGGPNVQAATWGRHGGVGAGIGGVSAAGYGGEFIGGKAHVRLIQTSAAPAGPPTGAGHLLGELYADGAGNLFFNRSDGENFTQLNNQITMFVDPQRAFDSRTGTTPANTNKGRFGKGETRVIDLAQFTDLPVGARGALVNLTVNEPTLSGYATIFSGDTPDADRPNASSINWGTGTQVLANGLTIGVGSAGTIKVFTFDATDVIIDLTGYIW